MSQIMPHPKTAPTALRLKSQHYPATHRHIHIVENVDIIVLTEACRRGILSLAEDRLNESEKASAISEWSVFIVQKSDDLQRWTDGRTWTASRKEGLVFFYDETEAPPRKDRQGSGQRAKEFPLKPNGLRKWTYAIVQHDYSVSPVDPVASYQIIWYEPRAIAAGSEAPLVSQYDYLRPIVPPPHIKYAPLNQTRQKPHRSISALADAPVTSLITLPPMSALMNPYLPVVLHSRKGRIPLPPISDIEGSVGTENSDIGLLDWGDKVVRGPIGSGLQFFDRIQRQGEQDEREQRVEARAPIARYDAQPSVPQRSSPQLPWPLEGHPSPYRPWPQ